VFALIFFLMGFFLGPKLNTCFQKFWATTRAMALLALGLGPPLEAGAEPGEGAGARGRSGGVLGEGATPRGRVRATEES